jgi:hypothetical protein
LNLERHGAVLMLPREVAYRTEQLRSDTSLLKIWVDR